MSEELKQYKAFLQHLAENPNDGICHRVFADWLEEHDEPEEAEEHRKWSLPLQEAKDFLRELACELRMSYERLLQDGSEIAAGTYCFGSDDAPDTMRSYWKVFLKHWKVLHPEQKGKELDVQHTHFRCSC